MQEQNIKNTESGKSWVIYALKCPRTQEVRYVGWTKKSAEKRLSAHIAESLREDRTHKHRWIVSLLTIGLRPVVDVLQSGNGDWAQAECFWISHYRACGARLTNSTDGGEGFRGWGTHEERSAIAKRRQQSMTPEQRSAIARKRESFKTPEQRSADAKKQWAGMTSEERKSLVRRNFKHLTFESRSAAAERGHQKRTSEERSASAKEAKSRMTPEARRAVGINAWARRTPEQRSAIFKKAASTRLLNSQRKHT